MVISSLGDDGANDGFAHATIAVIHFPVIVSGQVHVRCFADGSARCSETAAAPVRAGCQTTQAGHKRHRRFTRWTKASSTLRTATMVSTLARLTLGIWRMARSVVLHGYKYSVYSRIVQIVLKEKEVQYSVVEVDPFSENIAATYLQMQPFGRVPTLTHGAFVLYETSAIERYLDLAFDGPRLTPAHPRAAARMAQVIAIADNYGYWPMVRQVFAHRVFRPLQGEAWSESEISVGLEVSRSVLRALDVIAGEGDVLDGRGFTLADCHLAPIIDYFVAAPEGAALFRSYPALLTWWSQAAEQQSMIETDPGRPHARV